MKRYAIEIALEGKLVVRVGIDGSVEFGEGFTPNEAAKQFWEILSKAFPDLFNPENAALRSQLAEVQRELSGTPDNAVWSKQQWIDNAAYWNKAWKEAVEYRDMNYESVQRLVKELDQVERDLATAQARIALATTVLRRADATSTQNELYDLVDEALAAIAEPQSGEK